MESLKRLVRTLLAIGQTRLELLSNELEEERVRLTRILVIGSLTLFFFGLALLLATVFLVVLFWDNHRLLMIGGLTGLFTLAGLLALNAFRAMCRERPRLFAASLNELNKDREQLAPHS